MEVVYKIFTTSEWDAARRSGVFSGSEDDKRDGFIHLSTAEQVAGTLAKHYAGRGDLVLAAVDLLALGNDVRWEPARDGALFPHFYGELDLAAIRHTEPLTLGKDERHRLPAFVE